MTNFINLFKKLQVHLTWLKTAAGLAAIGFLSLMGTTAQSQTIYGVGSTAAAGPFTSTYIINPATGATTANCPTPFSSAAIGVASLDGLIYFIEQNVANPRIQSVNPVTCALGTAVATTLPNPTLRATSCPDGRFYAMGATLQFFEINPVTGATIRTLNLTGPVAGGSGDFGCTSNGDLYLLANPTAAATIYNLYSVASASFQSVATGSTVAFTNVGSLGLTGAPNGISEAPAGLPGCAAAPAPCLVATTGGTLQIWQINSLTGAATNVGPSTGITLVDLSRSFPVDLSVSKSVTPTLTLQGTQTVVYSLTVTNAGPGAVRSVTVTDTLSPAFASANWSCSVSNPGTATLIATGCGIASTGTGNINNTVSLSIGGSLRYTITATLSSTFSGTLTNAVGATMSAAIFDPTPGNNNATATATVNPAASLSVTKTDGTTTVPAGGTTAYTVTFTNSGPGSANGATVTDVASAGLSACTVVSCAAVGAAVCPATIANLIAPGGITVATFPAGSSLNFIVRCRVSATGQ